MQPVNFSSCKVRLIGVVRLRAVTDKSDTVPKGELSTPYLGSINN